MRGHAKHLVPAGMPELISDKRRSPDDAGSATHNRLMDAPAFSREALIAALRIDQAGESTFPQLLHATRRTGVVRYDADSQERTVAYFGCNGEEYIEAYSSAEVN